MNHYLAIPLLGGLILSACGVSGTQDPPMIEGMKAGVESNFSLADVNESSTRFGEMVSPRDYLEKVTGWYFGRAT